MTHGVSAGEVVALFAALMTVISQQASVGIQTTAVQQTKELKNELAKGTQADDHKIAKIVGGLADKVPGAVTTVLSMFATLILGGGLGGLAAKFVSDKHKSS